jgi:hypothetical protein
MNEPPQTPDQEPEQPSLLQSRPLPPRQQSSPQADQPPPEQRPRREERAPREPRPDRPERPERGRGRNRQPDQASGPPPPRQPRAVRGQSGGEVSLKTIAIVAFVFGVFLHGCVAWSFLEDDGLPTEAEIPTVVVTSTAAHQGTTTPTPLPDRTSCDEIRGTEYRSDAERDFFRKNCITG